MFAPVVYHRHLNFHYDVIYSFRGEYEIAEGANAAIFSSVIEYYQVNNYGYISGALLPGPISRIMVPIKLLLNCMSLGHIGHF